MTNLLVAIIYFILIVIVGLTIFFAYVRDRGKLVTKHLIRLCMITVGWQVFATAYFMVGYESIALWFFDAKLMFVAFAPVQLLMLSVRFYSATPSRRTSLLFGLLCIIPTVTAVLAVTAPFHNLLRTELSFVEFTPLRVLINTRGPWFWVHSGYSYVMMVASIFTILFQHSKLPKGFRTPSVLVACGSAIALFSNAFVIFTPLSQDIDITLVGLSIALVFTYAGIAISDESSLLVQAFDNIFAYIEDYIFVLNTKRSVVEMNPAARTWLRAMDITDDIVSFDELLSRLTLVTGDAIQTDDVSGRDFDLTIGQQISHYSLNERPIIDQTGRVIGTFAIFNDITRYKLLIERMDQSAGMDPLTGLGNRRSYEQALALLDKPASLPISVILGDVNGLKVVNDNDGHAAGDNLLRTIAQTLSGACPEGVCAYRIGGDEFVMLLPRTTTAEAEAVVVDIRDMMAKVSAQSPYYVSIALGVATKESEDQNLLESIALADSNMYTNKQNDRRRSRRD